MAELIDADLQRLGRSREFTDANITTLKQVLGVPLTDDVKRKNNMWKALHLLQGWRSKEGHKKAASNGKDKLVTKEELSAVLSRAGFDDLATECLRIVAVAGAQGTAADQFGVAVDGGYPADHRSLAGSRRGTDSG